MDREKTTLQYTCSRRKNKSIITIINNKTMKPFDIEKAKQGKSVCNGYGMDVRILCYDLKDDKYPVAGAITDPVTNRETLQKYTLDGYVIGDGANNKGDLFMKNEKRKM